MEKKDDIFGEIRRMLDEIMAFTGMMMGGGAMPMPSSAQTSEPLEDAIETDDEFILTLELPGVKTGDIRVNAGKTAIDVEVFDEANETLFAKTYRTQAGIKPKQIRVTHKNGVLQVRAPKK